MQTSLRQWDRKNRCGVDCCGIDCYKYLTTNLNINTCFHLIRQPNLTSMVSFQFTTDTRCVLELESAVCCFMNNDMYKFKCKWPIRYNMRVVLFSCDRKVNLFERRGQLCEEKVHFTLARKRYRSAYPFTSNWLGQALVLGRRGRGEWAWKTMFGMITDCWCAGQYIAVWTIKCFKFYVSLSSVLPSSVRELDKAFKNVIIYKAAVMSKQQNHLFSNPIFVPFNVILNNHQNLSHLNKKYVELTIILKYRPHFMSLFILY